MNPSARAHRGDGPVHVSEADRRQRRDARSDILAFGAALRPSDRKRGKLPSRVMFWHGKKCIVRRRNQIPKAESFSRSVPIAMARAGIMTA